MKREFRWLPLLVGLLLPVACSSGGAPPAGKERPNLLLITIDTLRADHLGCYGYRRPTSPTLDRIAREGVLVTHAFAQIPLTNPSHASFLTSLYPPLHGSEVNGQPVRANLVTLATVLKGAGYTTVAAVSNHFLTRAASNLAQGFDVYLDAMPDPMFAEPNGERIAAKTVGAVTDHFGKTGAARVRSPYFLWVHLNDPHQPYNAPEPYASRFTPPGRRDLAAATIARYDGEIAYTDHWIGQLLDRLGQGGWLADTLLVVSADHGESLGEHEYFNHSNFLYDPDTHIPLLFHWPGRLPTGGRLRLLVETIDVMPTCLDLLGVPQPEGLMGRSLAPVLLRRGAAGKARVFACTFAPEAAEDRFSIRTPRHRLVHSPQSGQWELYDLGKDPGETVNLWTRKPPEGKTLKGELETWRRMIGRNPAQLTEEQKRKLKALGYLQ